MRCPTAGGKRSALTPSRFTADLQVIVQGAERGRVECLFLRASVDQRILNLAAVETIRCSGKVFILPAEKMTHASAAAELSH